MTGIVFEPLTSSPETYGAGAIPLPALTAFGLQAAGNYGVLVLPRLGVVADGMLHRAANGEVYLPALEVIGFQAAGPYGVAALPALASYGQPPSLIPQAGSGSPELPALEASGAGYRALTSDVTLALAPLWAYGQQAAGGWGIVELPRLATIGAEAPESASFFYLVQSAGYLQAFASDTQYATLDAAAVVAMTPDVDVLANLIARLTASDGLTAKGKFGRSLTSAAGITDAVGAAWHLLLESTAVADVTTEGTVKKLVAIAERVSALGMTGSRLKAYIAVAMAAVVEGQASAGWGAEVVDQAAITDATASTLRAMLAVAETAAVSDAAQGTMLFSLLAESTANASDAITSGAKLKMELAAGAVAYASFRIGATDYSGWILNTDLQAVTEHRNAAFESIVFFNGKTYAAGDGGIVVLEGATDKGQPIDARVTPFLTDFGSSKFKKVKNLWLGIASDGQMRVRVLTRDPNTGLPLEDVYAVVRKQGANTSPGRVEIGQGLKSTFWGMTLENIDGADFALDSIEWHAIVLDRRQ